MTKAKTKKLAIILLIAAGTISGISSPVIHFALKTVPTPLFGFLRLVIPLVLITPLFLLKSRKRLSWQSIALAAVYGVLIYFAANGLFYLGVKRSGAVNAAIIGLLEPILMFTFSVEIMKEKFSNRILMGILLAFGGSLVVIFGPIAATGHLGFDSNIVGNLLLVGCVLCGVTGTLLAKSVLKHIDRIQLLFWSLVAGTAVYGVLSVGQWNQVPGIVANTAVLIAILYGAVFNGLFAYLFSFYALSQVRGQEYGVFEYVSPAVATTVAVIFFGEKFTPVLLLGVSVIALGLYLAEFKRHKVLSIHSHWTRR